MSKFIVRHEAMVNLNCVSHFFKIEHGEGVFNFHIRFHAFGTKCALFKYETRSERDAAWETLQDFVKSSKRFLNLDKLPLKKIKKKIKEG